MTDALPASLSVHLDAYAEHLRLSRGRSEHTIRAYVGDARALLTHFAAGSENADLDRLDLGVMRSWLAAQNAVGTARTTVARRASSARGFTAWLAQTGRISVDPGTRLAAPPARRTLPTVLRQSQALDAMDAAESGAQQQEPLALRDRLIVELLYSTGIRVGELCGLDVESVDADRRLLRVLGKVNKERSVPYGLPAESALNSWLEHGPTRAEFGSVRASVAPRSSRRPARSASGAFGGPRNHGCNSRGSRHGSARASALGCDTFAGGWCGPSCGPRTPRSCEFGDHSAVHARVGRTASIRPRSGPSARLICGATRVLGRYLVASQLRRVNNRQSSIVVSRHSITCDIRGIREPPRCEAPAEQRPTSLAVRIAATGSRAGADAGACGATATRLVHATATVEPTAGDKPGSGCRSFTETPETDAAWRLA